MKILVTGSRGFIGSRLVEKLKRWHEVIGYDILDGNDLRDMFKLEQLFNTENFDLVFHLAARAGVPMGEAHPYEYFSSNIEGTYNVVKCCQKYGTNKLVSFSSSSVLGGNTDNRGLTESRDYNPLGVYGTSKVAGEMLVKSSGLNYVIVRPFSVYGEGGRKDMVIYKWIESVMAGRPITVYGDGSTARGYTHVDDIVNAMPDVAALLDKYDGAPHLQNMRRQLVLHLGGSEVIRLRTLVEMLEGRCAKVGRKLDIINLPVPDMDITSSFADTTLAKSLVGFDPRKRFKSTLRKIINREVT